MKTVIVANDKRQADLIAKAHNLKPWQWRYSFGVETLLGVSMHATILVAANFVEAPQQRWVTTMSGPAPRWHWPVNEQLEALKMLGAEIVVVDT